MEGETITAIGRNLPVQADTIIDASGKLVFPGGIDPHVRLDMPFMGTFLSDTHETGTRAAMHGGTTTVIDFVLQKQGHSLKEALTEWNSRADGTTVGDCSFHMAGTEVIRCSLGDNFTGAVVIATEELSQMNPKRNGFSTYG